MRRRGRIESFMAECWHELLGMNGGCMSVDLKKHIVGFKHRPFLTPVWLAAIAAVIVIAFASWLWSRADSTTVIVIRHAEKQLDGTPDPELTPAGSARAQLLARLFGDPNRPGSLTAIYTSEARRAQLTVAPLAQRLGLAPIVVPSGDPRALARRVLREQAGGRVLIVGHSDTVPEIVSALSGVHDIPPIAATDYGTLYIVSVPLAGRPSLLRLSY
jgi:broad specificity phosphatase PhoE